MGKFTTDCLPGITYNWIQDAFSSLEKSPIVERKTSSGRLGGSLRTTTFSLGFFSMQVLVFLISFEIYFNLMSSSVFSLKSIIKLSFFKPFGWVQVWTKGK
jgi:hypothetical protein